MKATLFLHKDHERVHELFERFQRTKVTAQNGRRMLFDEIRRELSVHSNIETDLFYPELETGVSARAAELVHSALKDHARMEELLDEIETAGEKDFESKIRQLIDVVTAHVRHEEEEIFPEARSLFSEQRLEELGLEMEQRKRILTQAAA